MSLDNENGVVKQIGVIKRITEYPCCNAGISYFNSMYNGIKNRSSFLNASLGICEKSAETLYDTVSCVYSFVGVERIVTKLNVASHNAMDQMEHTLPIIKEQPNQVICSAKSTVKGIALPYATEAASKLRKLLSFTEKVVDLVLPRVRDCKSSKLDDEHELRQLEVLEKYHSKLLADSLHEPDLWDQRVTEFRAIKASIFIIKERIKYRGLNRILNSQLVQFLKNYFDFTRYSGIIFLKCMNYQLLSMYAYSVNHLTVIKHYFDQQQSIKTIKSHHLFQKIRPIFYSTQKSIVTNCNKILIILYNRQLYYSRINGHLINYKNLAMVNLVSLNAFVQSCYLSLLILLSKRTKRFLYHFKQHLLLLKLYSSIFIRFMIGKAFIHQDTRSDTYRTSKSTTSRKFCMSEF